MEFRVFFRDGLGYTHKDKLHASPETAHPEPYIPKQSVENNCK
jgi:hypothetical protein